MELNFEGPEMQKGNIQTDRTQRVDEKNRMISVGHFLCFLLITKESQSLRKIFRCT